MTTTTEFVISVTQKQWNIIALASKPTDAIGYGGAVYYPDHNAVAASDRFVVAAIASDGYVPVGLKPNQLGRSVAIPRDVVDWIKREMVGTRNEKRDLVFVVDEDAGTMTASVGAYTGAPTVTHPLVVGTPPALLGLIAAPDTSVELGNVLGFTAKTFRKLTAMTQGDALWIYPTAGQCLRTDLHDVAICFTRANHYSH